MKKAKGVDHELDMDLPADATAEDIAWLKKNKAAAEMMSLQSTFQKQKIWKVSALVLLCKVTKERAFENFEKSKKSPAAAATKNLESHRAFWKVAALICSLYKASIASTFEK